MRTILAYAAVLALGVGAGVAGSAVATKLIFPDMQIKLEEGIQKQKFEWESVEKDGFVVGPVTMPVSDPNGRFMGYIQVTARMIGPKPRLAIMQQRLPEVLDIINRTAWKAPIGINAESKAIDIYEVKRMMFEASTIVYGDDALDLSVTSVIPA